MANLFRCGNKSDSNKSVVVPRIPPFYVEKNNKSIDVTIDFDDYIFDVEVSFLNIYISTSLPSSLSDMNLVTNTDNLKYKITGLSNDRTYYVSVNPVSVDGYENASITDIKSVIPSSTLFVAVGENGKVYKTTNGTSWSSITNLPSSYTYYCACYCNRKLVTIGYYSNYSLTNSYYSTDFSSWTEMTGLSNTLFNCVCYGNGKYVCAAQYGYIYISSNGTSWYQSEYSNGYVNFNIYGIAFGNNVFVCVGSDYKAFYSYNADSWYPCIGFDSNTNNSLYNVRFVKDRFIAVAYQQAYYSFDGIFWRNMSGLYDSSTIRDVTYGNSRFICVGDSGYSYYSTDGLHWDRMTGLSSSSDYFSVTYSNGASENTPVAKESAQAPAAVAETEAEEDDEDSEE